MCACQSVQTAVRPKKGIWVPSPSVLLLLTAAARRIAASSARKHRSQQFRTARLQRRSELRWLGTNIFRLSCHTLERPRGSSLRVAGKGRASPHHERARKRLARCSLSRDRTNGRPHAEKFAARLPGARHAGIEARGCRYHSMITDRLTQFGRVAWLTSGATRAGTGSSQLPAGAGRPGALPVDVRTFTTSSGKKLLQNTAVYAAGRAGGVVETTGMRRAEPCPMQHRAVN